MKKIIVGNLKMNLLSIREREEYLARMKKAISKKNLQNVEIVLCPPFIHLEAFNKNLGKKIYPIKSPKNRGVTMSQFNGVKLGAQNCFSEKQGSFTGEISPVMLKNLGCEYVILGHSERRRYQGETGDEISLKVISSIKNGLIPILCIGEKKEERESGKTAEIISRQVIESLSRIRPAMLEKIVICYEPVWSVGSDNVPTGNQTMEARLIIKKVLVEIFGKKFAQKARIIYGGSVSVKFVNQACVEPGMEGVLVGRESLTPNEFIKIAEIINQ